MLKINTCLSKKSLPQLEQLDFLVDVTIRVRRTALCYEADINYVPVTLGVTANDRADWSRRLRQCIAILLETYDEDGTNRHMRNLAELGHYVWQRLFGSDGLDHRAQRILRAALQSERTVNIQIVSEDCFLPWDLLYDGELSTSVDPGAFWGARYPISRLMLPPGEAHFKPRYILTDLPRMGLCADNTLTAVREREIPFFRSLADEGMLDLSVLRPLDPSCGIDELLYLRGFLADELDLAHFACHAAVNDEARELSYIRLSDGYEVTVQDIVNYRIRLDNNPLVVLNACGTGDLSPMHTSDLVRILMDAGARSVVVTECAVPDAFAAEFSELLYENLLSGKTVGDSLFEARRYFLFARRNPLGLVYALYGYPSVCLRRIGT